MTGKKPISEKQAVAGLVAAALFWGLSYPLTKYVENCPTFYIISLRFAAAALFLTAAFHKKLILLNGDVVKYGFLLSFPVFLMFAFGIWGIKYTTSVRASFFTCLSFLIVPLLNRILFRVRISKIIGLSSLICLAGMFLLCYTPDMGSFIINPGDFLCILAAAAGSLHIILVEKVSKKDHVDPSLFTIFLMSFVSLWGTLAALSGGELSYRPHGSEIISILLMGLLCSAVAFCLQTHLEAIVPANRIGVIFSLEPASGCILSVVFLHETMGLTGWAGAAVIMASILYMETATARESSLQDTEEKKKRPAQ